MLDTILDDLGAEITRLSDQAVLRGDVDTLTAGHNALSVVLADHESRVTALESGVPPSPPPPLSVSNGFKRFVGDRNNTTDETGNLTQFISDCQDDGDFAYLPPGYYKTSDEVTIDLNPGGRNLLFTGAGVHSMICPVPKIVNGVPQPYHAIRVKGDSWHGAPNGRLSMMSVYSASPTPQDGKAAFLFDGVPAFIADGLSAYGKDIGFDLVNNNYNFVGMNLTCWRGGGRVNVGLNLREGPQSGSDLHFYHLSIQANAHAINIQGGGGSYGFFGGQLGVARDWEPEPNDAAVRDNLGVINLGYNYPGQVPHGGLPGVNFYRTSTEGPNNVWCIRSHADGVQANFNGCSWYASGSQEKRCLGLMKATNAGGSQFAFDKCNIAGHYGKWAGGAQNVAQMIQIQGGMAEGSLTEEDWHISWPGLWMRDGSETWHLPRGFGALAGHPTRGGWRGAQMIGGKLHRYVDAKPTSGDWRPGDKAWLNQPTATVDGWSCRSTSPLTFGTIKLA